MRIPRSPPDGNRDVFWYSELTNGDTDEFGSHVGEDEHDESNPNPRKCQLFVWEFVCLGIDPWGHKEDPSTETTVERNCEFWGREADNEDVTFCHVCGFPPRSMMMPERLRYPESATKVGGQHTHQDEADSRPRT